MTERQVVSPSSIVEKFLRGKIEEKREVILGKEGTSELERFVRELRDGVSFTKLRKYYEQFLNIYEGWQASRKGVQGEPLNDETLLKLYMLKSLLTYDIARERKKEKKEALRKFREFVEKIVNLVERAEDLESAKYLFEALVGYAKEKLR